MAWVNVRFHSQSLWVEEEVLHEGSGPLAPDSHITDGELDYLKCFSSDTYAHVGADGNIRRFGSIIGTRADLIAAASAPKTEPAT